MNTRIRVLYVGTESTGFEPEFLEQYSECMIVSTEPTASDGLARLRGEPIDCVVSAYDLPHSTGIRLLEQIRDIDPDLPFILFTNEGNETLASDAIAAGTTDYLQYRPEADQAAVLTNRIENAVEQFRARRRAEEQERISSVIREINRALIRADSSTDVEQAVCDIVSDAEPYLTACIADVDSETMRIHPRTWRGAARGYFQNLDMVVAEDAPGRQAPGGRAYHDREIAVSQNIPHDSQYEKWRPEATDRGFQALAVVPLEYDDDLYGLLAVFADRPQAFDESEQQLLSELGNDIAHALHAQQLQSDLEKTTSRLEALFEQSPDMINVHDPDGNLIDPNPKLREKTGYDRTTLANMKVWDLDQTIDAEETQAIWESLEKGDMYRHEGRYQRADGSTFPVEVHIRQLELGDDARFMAISRDISAQKRRQQDLERYRHIVENLPVGVFRTTPEGELINTNPRFVSLFGGESGASFSSRTVDELYVDETDRMTLLTQLEEEGAVEGEIIQVRTLDGEKRWVETTLRLVEENGQQYLDGIVQDVTERRERERRLEESEMFFEHAQVGLFLIDVTDEFRIQRVNHAYEHLTGLPAEAVVGRTPTDILGNGSGEAVETKYRRCVHQSKPLEYEEELQLDGDLTYWATRIAPVVNNGEVEKIVGSTRDITDRKERERSLRRNERRFKAIVNDPHILVGLLDTDGTISHANDTAMGYIDADLEEVRDTKLWRTPWWSDELRPLIKQNVEQAASGEYVTYEADLTDSSGEPYNVVGVIRPVRDAQGEVVSLVISARDVTERKKREQQLNVMDRVLRHNFHNEMSVILGAADTITSQAGSEVADLAKMIQRSGQELLEITDKQRDIVDVISENPDVTSVSITPLVRRCVTEVSETHPAAEIALSVPRDVRAQAIPQLGQAIRELIRNAIEHAENASPAVEVTTVSTSEGVRISVTDSGPRMPPQERMILLSEGAPSPLYHGSGMGLWLVNWIVSRSDGRVTYEENTPSGNTVTIELSTPKTDTKP